MTALFVLQRGCTHHLCTRTRLAMRQSLDNTENPMKLTGSKSFYFDARSTGVSSFPMSLARLLSLLYQPFVFWVTREHVLTRKTYYSKYMKDQIGAMVIPMRSTYIRYFAFSFFLFYSFSYFQKQHAHPSWKRNNNRSSGERGLGRYSKKVLRLIAHGISYS